jgi:hypothetical protein
MNSSEAAIAGRTALQLVRKSVPAGRPAFILTNADI